MTSSPSRFSTLALERLLIAGLILLPPIFVWFWGFDGYGFPKRILISILVSALGAVAAWRAVCSEPLRIELHPANLLLLLWWLWNAVSILWAESPSLAIERVVWLSILLGALVLVQNHWIGRRNAILKAAHWMVLAASLLSIWVLFMDFWGLVSPASVPVLPRLGDWRDRVSVAGLGNTGHIADFVVLSFPAAFLFYLHAPSGGRRATFLTALLLISAALIVCWSVHSNASLIVVFLLGLPFLLRLHNAAWWRRKLGQIGILLAAWLLVVAFYVLPHPANPHPGGIFREAFSSQRWAEGLPTRVAIWKTTLAMIRQNPVLGVGAGNFTYAYPSISADAVRHDPELAAYAHRWTNAAHNEILQTWAETGVIGLLLLAAAIVVAIASAVRRMRYETAGNRMVLWCAALALAAWALQAQMNFPLQMPVAALAFILFLSAPSSLAPRFRRVPSAILFPVEFERAGLRLSIYMKNMRRPTRLALEAVWPPAAGRAAALLLAGCAAAVLLIGLRGLSAQVELRKGKEAAAFHVQPQFAFSPTVAEAALEAAEPHYQAALRRWPWLTDVRSAWTDLLVRAGDCEEALRQNAIVRRRLDATEVYFREAWCRFSLGETDKAREAFATILGRSVQSDFNHDSIPDNLSLDPYWAAVYFRLLQHPGQRQP